MAAERDNDADLRPRDQLIAELRALCAAKRTGTLFIITLENHPAQIVLRDGDNLWDKLKERTPQLA